MNALANATAAASSAQTGSLQGAAALLVMNKAKDIQASSALQLLNALPQPALATSGHLGTQVNTFA